MLLSRPFCYEIPSMELSSYLIYLSVSIVASVSIGPSAVLAASNGLNFGRRKALSGVLGHVTAIFILAILSAAGIGSIFLASEWAYQLIRVLGCLYLIHIGISMWRSKGNWSLIQENTNTPSSKHLYKKSLLLGLSNPKALVFFTALFPQFLNLKAALLPQLTLLISTSLVNAFLFTFLYALIGYNFKARLLPLLNGGRLGRIMGSMFFGFAAMLAVSK
ncbi:LysE family translocator [Litorilituus sediminis]|uniref:LysE family translocator n=2 Tax=Litorilituus sediminis TaxID=718192 RepID=A0A4V0ZG99_9GAMM|nr:LysE family translocator [Litorilituus sediminis]